ncbi:MAG: hypothetical protein IKZ48_07335 [Prevotella sp.]|nr:hypothetical protein [Prevotella sp.]
MARFLWQLERTSDACCDGMVTDFLDISLVIVRIGEKSVKVSRNKN